MGHRSQSTIQSNLATRKLPVEVEYVVLQLRWPNHVLEKLSAELLIVLMLASVCSKVTLSTPIFSPVALNVGSILIDLSTFFRLYVMSYQRLETARVFLVDTHQLTGFERKYVGTRSVTSDAPTE
jgi:hypothetical protein